MIRPQTRSSQPRDGLAVSLAAFAVVAVAAGCSSSGSTPANAITSTASANAAATSGGGVVSVRIPDPGNSGVLAVGKKDGSLAAALAKVNAKVVWTGTTGPFAPAAEEMAASKLDFAQGSITSAVTSLAATPVFELFAQQPPDRVGEGILVNSGSKITTVQDLVGKTVAVNKGGTGEYLLRKALAAAGIPVSKVNLVYLSPAQTAPVLNSGKVDAWATWASYSVAEVGLDGAKFVETGGQFGSENYSVWAVRTGFAKEYPQVVAALYDYLHSEGSKLVADPDEFINVFTTSGAQALNTAEEAFDAKDTAALGTTNPITASITSQFQAVSDFFATEGVTKSAIKVAPYVIQPVSAG
jgi:sulfonate transport system substrate-binding protein